MPPVTSNHGGCIPYRETVTVEKKGFQIPPPPSSCRIGMIYTMRFKYIYLDHLRPYYIKSGERVQQALVYIHFYQAHQGYIYVQLGANGANLRQFWRAKYFLKFKNFGKCFRIPKYHALGHPSVKLQLTLSSQIVDIIICPHPIFQHRCYLSLFGLFVL